MTPRNILPFLSSWFQLICILHNGFGAIIELGNKNYTVNFQVISRYQDDRLESSCKLTNENVTWYFKHLHDDKPYQVYPFKFCHSNRECDLEDNNKTLVVKKFSEVSEGDYICVDGQEGQGITVSLGCRIPIIQPLSFNNQTGTPGENVTFSCQVDIGREECYNDACVWFSNEVNNTINFDRSQDGRLIRGQNLTIYGVKDEDFNKEYVCCIMDEDGEPTTLKAMLLKKDAPVIYETKVDPKIIAGVVVSIFILIGCVSVAIWLCRPRIRYFKKRLFNSLPDQENKIFHGLILYDGESNTYDKVQELKSALSKYELREFPPGPETESDQTAGYANFELLDNMVQECSCVIILGELGEAGEVGRRCLSEYKGKHVTHILLSVTEEKKINPIYWPSRTTKFTCLRRLKWNNFIYEVRMGLPKPNRKISRSNIRRSPENGDKCVEIESISLTHQTENDRIP